MNTSALASASALAVWTPRDAYLYARTMSTCKTIQTHP
jgi:hypothetical protein